MELKNRVIGNKYIGGKYRDIKLDKNSIYLILMTDT